MREGGIQRVAIPIAGPRESLPAPRACARFLPARRRHPDRRERRRCGRRARATEPTCRSSWLSRPGSALESVRRNHYEPCRRPWSALLCFRRQRQRFEIQRAQSSAGSSITGSTGTADLAAAGTLGVTRRPGASVRCDLRPARPAIRNPSRVLGRRARGTLDDRFDRRRVLNRIRIEREELAEDLLRIQSNLLRVGAHVGPPEKTSGPSRHVVAFEPFEQGGVDFCFFGDCRELHVLLFTLRAESRPECQIHSIPNRGVREMARVVLVSTLSRAREGGITARLDVGRGAPCDGGHEWTESNSTDSAHQH